jgi:succinate dehydrogenase flavin-adding protein (antitoxin of CptAB toxin-antitoxin module)
MSYQSEKLNQARRALMLPHQKGEAASIASAFLEIDLALHHFDETSVESYARDKIQRLRQIMDTSAKQHGSETGAWTAKAKGFSFEEKLEVSNLVDQLAWWFGENARK